MTGFNGSSSVLSFYNPSYTVVKSETWQVGNVDAFFGNIINAYNGSVCFDTTLYYQSLVIYYIIKYI